MDKRRLRVSLLATVMMSLVMVIMCAAFSYAASNESASSANSLTLGKKAYITIGSELKNKYYKIKITKKGTYKMYIYSDSDNANDYFWVGVYGSAKDAKNDNNLINSESGTYNTNNSETDYQYYKFSKGTYYICVQAWDENHRKTGLKIVRATNTYECDINDLYKYEESYVGVWNLSGKTATVTSVKSSKSSIVKVIKSAYYDKNGKKHYEYSIKGKKVGTAKITVKYTTSAGKKYTVTKKIKVTKYPPHIKSLKVNGKTVSISKHRFNYSVYTTKTTAKVKLALKNGWKISYANINLDNWETGAHKEISESSAKKKILNGTSFTFAKKYDVAYVYVEMTNGDDYIYYYIDIYRK